MMPGNARNPGPMTKDIPMRALPSAFALFLAFGLAGTMPLTAGPITDKAAEAEGLLTSGDDLGAVLAARDSYAATWEATTALAIGDTALIVEPASGFGVYNPRPDDRFKLGEPVQIYVEPIGFGYGSPAEGLYSIGFFVDLKVVNEAGEVLGDLQNLTELDMSSRHKNREFQANLTYNLEGVPTGRYVLVTTLRDKNSAKMGSFETTVEFVE
jgi:hypothetical protein